MLTYHAYGLNIHSEVPLPELPSGEATPDVTIALGEVGPAPCAIDGAGHGFWAEPGAACHFRAGVGAFLVRVGRRVIVDPVPRVEPAVLRLSLLGPVFGLLLHQRGYLVLHASAIVVDGRAVAFVGGRGWGKSTVAAALHARGHGILTDDITAVDLGGQIPAVLPGFPQLKLWPDSVVSLGGVPEALPRLHPRLEKRAFRVSSGVPPHPVSLDRIYVLADGPEPAVEPIPSRTALLALLQHWYGGRFGDGLLGSGNAAAHHLRQCASVATTLTVRRLKRPHRAASVLDLAGLVEADLAH